ncbi:hypothetical protein EG329_004488 [Mollisiaceae sp. DMI_Dod_QoI]|nr:hypothetical protein EG329_004488 [Helotiales sp. DMI_Dod_QoI]
MPSIVLVAPPATTSSSGISSMPQKTSSGFVTTTSSLQTASASKTTSASSSVSAEAANKTSTPTPAPLSKPQIVGITVAAIGGTAVALGLVICFACWRRRKFKRSRESDLIPFQLNPPAHLMEKKKYRYTFRGPTERKPGGTANGIAAKVPPPIPPRIDTSDPLMFSRRSIRPDTIGVAISPDTKVSAEAQQRRSSRLLPEKPTLKLKMPPAQEREYIGGLSFSQPIIHPSIIGRQSVATQFEEDFESANTAVNADDPWSRKSTDQILNNSPSNGKPFRAVYPDNENNEFVWRPGQAPNTNGAPDLYVRPLSIGGRMIGSFSQPRKPDAYPPIQLEIPDARPVTGGSSVYSARGSVRSSDGGRASGPGARRSYRQAGPYDSEPIELTFSSEDVEPRSAEPRTAINKDLSPVVESPASGRSPVSYPKIPESVSPTILRMNYGPPPPQPDFTRAMGSGQAQQPWRAAEIKAQRERERIAREQAQARTRSPPQQMPQRAASTTGHRRQNSREKLAALDFPVPPSQAVIRSQSPNSQGKIHPALRTNPGSEPQIEPPPRSRTAPLTDATGGWNYNPYNASNSQSKSQSRNQDQSESQARPQPRPYQQLQRQDSNQIPSTTTSSSTTLPISMNPLANPSWQPQAQPRTKNTQPSITLQHPTLTRSSSAMSTYSHASQVSKNSTSSSLLAKRLGEQKASKLALRTEDMNEGKRRQQAKWRVLGKEEKEAAKEGGWRPMLGRGDGFGKGLGDEEGEGSGGRLTVQYAGEGERGREFERMDLPATPGWLPKLTPTRRGDELFLSVQ